mgnify:CR=1 FL=1
MRVLVVYAHPDSASFNYTVLDEVLAGLQSARHEVRVRDLYAEGVADSALGVDPEQQQATQDEEDDEREIGRAHV